jgi:nitrogen fixation NifU-like protein
MLYSKTVMDHFRNPRNVGVIEDANGVGEVGNPLCGDMMTIYLKIEEDRISDIKFQTFGCGSAIAVSSMLTEIAMGKTVAEAKSITNKDVAQALEGLPKNKLHCSNLGADALQLAIKNYEDGGAALPLRMKRTRKSTGIRKAATVTALTATSRSRKTSSSARPASPTWTKSTNRGDTCKGVLHDNHQS